MILLAIDIFCSLPLFSVRVDDVRTVVEIPRRRFASKRHAREFTPVCKLYEAEFTFPLCHDSDCIRKWQYNIYYSNYVEGDVHFSVELEYKKRTFLKALVSRYKLYQCRPPKNTLHSLLPGIFRCISASAFCRTEL